MYMDFSKWHPLAKQYMFSIFTLQQFLSNFNEQNATTLKLLRENKLENMQRITQSLDQQQYYRVFDFSLKSILNILKESLAKNKEAQLKLNQAVPGSELFSRIVRSVHLLRQR